MMNGKGGVRVKKLTDQTRFTDAFELLESDWLKDWLALNGFTENGSHYDVFARLCASAERDPCDPAVRRAEEILTDLLQSPVTLSTATCPGVWLAVAEALLLAQEQATPKRDCTEAQPSVSLPSHLFVAPPACEEISVLCQSDCQSWRSWEEQRVRLLKARAAHGVRPRLLLPQDFFPIKPSLYRVERILAGEEESKDLWQTQMAYFLFRACAPLGIRPVIATECSPEKLADLLKIVEKLTPLCNFIWQPSGEVRLVLPAICHIVMHSRRNSTEGEPPILIAKA